MVQINDILVVIRSVGERTEQAVLDIAEKAVGRDKVVVVCKNKFIEALQASFEAGIERDEKWTVCLDADALPLAESFAFLRSVMIMSKSNCFGVQGEMLDKLFGGERSLGGRIYRTALLSRALKEIGGVGKSKRPETFIVKILNKNGYYWQQSRVVTGIHGYEQSFVDMWRAGFWQAQKHKRFLPILKPYWQRMAVQDKDFAVALMGLSEGQKAERGVGLDFKNFKIDEIRKKLSSIGLGEKKAVENRDWEEYIRQNIRQHNYPVEYLKARKKMDATPSKLREVIRKLKRRIVSVNKM